MEDYLKLDVKRVYSPLALSVPKYEKSTRKDHQKQHTSFSILDLEGALLWNFGETLKWVQVMP